MTQQLLSPPEIPSKYDIIPIHQSDIASFLRCRRYWSWSSPARNNLRRKVELFGIKPELWFGSGIHYALEHYYNPLLKRDPVETYQTWWQAQWHGGVVTEDIVETSYDAHPRLVAEHDELVLGGSVSHKYPLNYEIRGLQDLLPDPNEEEFLEFRELGVGMMNFYKEYAAKNDDFEVVAAESKFSIPLEFEAIEIREDSPNFGKKLEVHLRGKRDMIVYYPERKDPRLQYGLVDHKTAGPVDDDYFLKLENDAQCTTYIVASIKEAEANDLPWTTIQDVLYQALRKVYPRPPTITTRGFPSLDRQKESATAEMFSQAIIELGLVDWFHNDPKAQGYYEYLLEEGDKVFIQRDHAVRNPHQVKVAFEELQMIAKEMLDPNVHIYKHPSGMSYCTRCQFRDPCLAKDDGSDWMEMLVQGYEQNRDR